MPNSIPHSIRDAILRQPNTELYYLTPPDKLVATPAATLDQLERDIDAPLPQIVREFYASTLELGVAWQRGLRQLPPTQEALAWNELSDGDGEFWQSVREGFPTDNSQPGGLICIAPAAEVFQKGFWLDRIVPEPSGDTLTLDGRAVADADLFNELYPFNFMFFYTDALWFDRANRTWRVVRGEDYGASWTDRPTMSVEEYFAKLVRLDADALRVEAPEPFHFPKIVSALADAAPRIGGASLQNAIARHARFVADRDPEVRFEQLSAGPVAFGLYGETSADDMAALEKLDALAKRADDIAITDLRELRAAFDDALALVRQARPLQLSLWLATVEKNTTAFEGADLTCASFVNTVCEDVSFIRATLDHSVAVDAIFDGADFRGASLKGVDFSRSRMRECLFDGADLDGTDFENVDLTGSDFGGADINRARFPGAVLNGVKRRAP